MNMCPRTPRISTAIGREYLLEEIIATVNLSIAREALLGELAFAFTTLDTLRVPGPIENVEEKSIQNGQVTACTLNHLHGHHTA